MAERRLRAGALRYDAAADGAPRLVAQGQGALAERILEVAREHGIPVREDPMLAEALALLELDQHIPQELYTAVAEALIWAWKLDNAS